ncbi:conserved hypothetical protein [Burkholderia sp. 8Y]|uniref:zinc-ribbon and DUF3426 domain-containing protein n=1 Tax=Burkholderia sp. 8Y TaxID=2653133 RepID=UPI0012F0C1DC|nr:zinc-ribbon and DUF3426 domain-containing protein [Burkholderia sp. 8Y]VXC42276.1 conserved hypothetical protein [Burkholderia sp. 8Y]
MALATRCPHCETVFKLDPHLLAPHDGRVRCGHCQEVFDAAHHRFELPDDTAEAGEAQHAALIDDEVAVGPSTFSSPKKEATSVPPTLTVPRQLDLGKQSAAKPFSPPPAKEDNDPTVLSNAPAFAGASMQPPPERSVPRKDAANEPDAEPVVEPVVEPFALGRVKPLAAPGAPLNDDVQKPQSKTEAPKRPEPAPPPSRFVDPLDDRAEPFIGPAHTRPEPPRARPAPAPAHVPSSAWDEEDEPGFGARPSGPGSTAHAPSANEAFPVTREPRIETTPPARPARKGLRALGVVAAVVLTLLLVVQLAWWQRETVMIYVPGSHAFYVNICDELGCTISPPRYISGLQIESSGLRQVDGPHKLELKLMLRNRSDVALAYPALELTLLDEKSDVAVRRVLWPQEYARPGTIFAIGLPPQSAQPVVVRLDTGDAVAANYRVQVFYP